MRKRAERADLKRFLREGERVLWSSAAEPFPLLAPDAEVPILAKWTVTCLVTIGTLWLYLGSGGTAEGVVGAILLIAAALVLSPVVEYRNLRRQQYWITSQRAVMMSADRTVYYLELPELQNFQVVHSRGGMDCLLLGGAAAEYTEGKMRWRSCHPELRDETSGQEVQAAGMIFFAVDSVNTAAAVLSRCCKAA